MAQTKYVTIMLIPDGTENRQGFRVRQWVLRAVLAGLAALLLGIILFFLFYGKILTKAAMADKLEEENKQLLKYHYKVQLLEENLNQTRAIVSRLTEMAGIDIELPTIPDDSVLFAAFDKQQKAIVEHNRIDDWSQPTGLPLAGFISQDFELADMNHFHPGVDIACAEGTPVLATAAGEVMYADFDSTYGYMVVLKHSDSVSTVYGHNSELLVNEGENVAAGSRIALSGNTGKSTAPHLHYEVRINDQPINPMEQ